jgi:hypothetical protein
MIPRLPGPWHPGPYPYEVFAGTPITPLASHGDVLAASLTLQSIGRMNLDDRLAFDRVRTLPGRLATDFFLYNPELADAAALARAAVAELEKAIRQGDV